MSKNRGKMRGDTTQLLNAAVDEATNIVARRIQDQFGTQDTHAKIDVAALRHRLGYTQSEFAAYFQVSVGTLRNWEQGRRAPQGPAQALLNIIGRIPSVLNSALGDDTRPQSPDARTGAFGAFTIGALTIGAFSRHSPVDVHIGQRIRQRRWIMGITQQQLGDQVGIKFQQIQKYETGKNRISASHMWYIASAMEVPVSFFFEGLEGQFSDTGEVRGDVLTDKEANELIRAYYTIPESQRRRLFDLARVLSEAS